MMVLDFYKNSPNISSMNFIHNIHVNVVFIGTLGNELTSHQIETWNEPQLLDILDIAWGIDIYDRSMVVSHTFEKLAERVAVANLKMVSGSTLSFVFTS
jgi:hypothetical protein